MSGFGVDDCGIVECRQHFDGGVKFRALRGVCWSRETDDAALHIS